MAEHAPSVRAAVEQVTSNADLPLSLEQLVGLRASCLRVITAACASAVEDSSNSAYSTYSTNASGLDYADIMRTVAAALSAHIGSLVTTGM